MGSDTPPCISTATAPGGWSRGPLSASIAPPTSAAERRTSPASDGDQRNSSELISGMNRRLVCGGYTHREAIDDMRSVLFDWAYFSLDLGQELPELPTLPSSVEQ